MIIVIVINMLYRDEIDHNMYIRGRGLARAQEHHVARLELVHLAIARNMCVYIHMYMPHHCHIIRLNQFYIIARILNSGPC